MDISTAPVHYVTLEVDDSVVLTVPLLPADVLKRQTAKLRQPTTQVRDSKGNDARAPEGQHAILVTFVSQNQFQGTLAIGCGFEG